MPPVRAPSGGNFFTDIGRAGGGLIEGVLERRKKEEEKARQAAAVTLRSQDQTVLVAVLLGRRALVDLIETAVLGLLVELVHHLTAGRTEAELCLLLDLGIAEL